jgi:hypothetical protein
MAHILNIYGTDRFLIYSDGSPYGQGSGLQIIDVPKVPNPVAMSMPALLPPHTTTPSLPLCGSGGNFENTRQKLARRVTDVYDLLNFFNFAGGVPCFEVNVTGAGWINGTSRKVGGGAGVSRVPPPRNGALRKTNTPIPSLPLSFTARSTSFPSKS